MSSGVKQQTIAERLNLSIGTVSMALRDSPLVAEDTRKQVLSVAQELGYRLRPRRSPRARAAALDGMEITFLSMFEATNVFYGAVLGGAERACRELQLELHYLAFEELSPRLLKQCAASDALLLVSFIPEAAVAQLQLLDRPMVLLDNNLPHLGLDRVLTENVGGVAHMVAYLVELGHRRIAFLHGGDISPSRRDRLSGYQSAMASFGLTPQVWPAVTDQRPESIARLVAGWCTAEGLPAATALIAPNDEVAIMVMHAIQDRGLRVPEDVSITGFDDIELSGMLRPGLTTRHVQREQLGALAVQQLIKRAQDPGAVSRALVLDTTLVVRGSTGRPRNA